MEASGRYRFFDDYSEDATEVFSIGPQRQGLMRRGSYFATA
jgi:hypothetical protein